MAATRIRVLFVDDEENNLKAFRSTFRREMDVLTAGSGPAALELLEREAVHVVISDQRMPGMTGAEFLAHVKERHPKVLRMLLTGYADMQAVVAAVNQGGIYAYATKPWDENDLRLRIEKAYEVYRLREEKEELTLRYQRIFETAGDPIVLVDARGAMIAANPACARLLGTTTGELLRTRFTDHLEEPGDLLRTLRRHRRGESFVNVDLGIRRADGSTVDALLTVTRLGRSDGGTPIYQAVIKDITDRKQEEKLLRRLNADLDKRVAARTKQLLEALEDLGAFSYTVAHDLRSPLKNIAALSEHLSEHVRRNADADGEAFTQRIQRSAQRMIGLVDDLLRFSQTNARDLECRWTALLPMVEEVFAEQVPEERRGQVCVDVDPATELYVDPPMLKVVLHNVLSNALKFTRGCDSPKIVIGHRQEGGQDLLWVRDNGVGFDPQHKGKVFGAFKRLHPADRFEGTGVGLAIVQRIVSKHRGVARIESAPGKGTVLEILLPRPCAAGGEGRLLGAA